MLFKICMFVMFAIGILSVLELVDEFKTIELSEIRDKFSLKKLYQTR